MNFIFYNDAQFLKAHGALSVFKEQKNKSLLKNQANSATPRIIDSTTRLTLMDICMDNRGGRRGGILHLKPFP